MVSQDGLVGQETFLPSIAKVKAWLDQTPCESLEDAPWRPKAISERPYTEPTEGERTANVERLRALQDMIRKTADSKMAPWKEYKVTDEETLKALENLESGKIK